MKYIIVSAISIRELQELVNKEKDYTCKGGVFFDPVKRLYCWGMEKECFNYE